MTTLEVRSLTVVPPWPLAIVRGWKPVENRTTNLAGNWRGRVLILAGSTNWDPTGVDFIAEQGFPQVRREECHPGHYIGAATLVDAHREPCRSCGRPRRPTHDLGAPGPTARHPFTLDGCCKPWGQLGTWHLAWENPVEFETPIKATGHLGLRWVTDPELIAVALEGVAA